jgi:hypothetical protein
MKKLLSTCFMTTIILAFVSVPIFACPDLEVDVMSWTSGMEETWILSTNNKTSGTGSFSSGYSNDFFKWSLYSIVSDCDVIIGSSIDDSLFSAKLGSGIFGFPALAIAIDGGTITKPPSSASYLLSGTGRIISNDLPVNFYAILDWEHLYGDYFNNTDPSLTLSGRFKVIGINAIPIPGTLMMLGTGLIGLLYVRRRLQNS